MACHVRGSICYIVGERSLGAFFWVTSVDHEPVCQERLRRRMEGQARRGKAANGRAEAIVLDAVFRTHRTSQVASVAGSAPLLKPPRRRPSIPHCAPSCCNHPRRHQVPELRKSLVNPVSEDARWLAVTRKGPPREFVANPVLPLERHLLAEPAVNFSLKTFLDSLEAWLRPRARLASREELNDRLGLCICSSGGMQGTS